RPDALRRHPARPRAGDRLRHRERRAPPPYDDNPPPPQHPRRGAACGVLGLPGGGGEAPIIVDGETGTVILHPTDEVVAQYRARKAELERHDRDLLEVRELKAVTRDGVEIALMANIDLPEEVDEVV